MKDRRTEISIETYEVLVTSRHSSLARSWCANCGKQVAAISLNDASLSGLSEEAVGQQAQSGRPHLIEAVGGLSLMCLNSLIQSGKENCNAKRKSE